MNAYDCDPSGMGCKNCPRLMDDCDGKEEQCCPNCGGFCTSTNSCDELLCENCGFEENGE